MMHMIAHCIPSLPATPSYSLPVLENVTSGRPSGWINIFKFCEKLIIMILVESNINVQDREEVVVV